jgi:glycosyltransferase involved in cell wall biosynthesis
VFPRDVTVIIPHIPVRPNKLARAVKSAAVQIQRAKNIIVATDVDREGSAKTRNRALELVRTTWVAFLDDDDYFYPEHLDVLLKHAEATKADVVYPGCHVIDHVSRPIPVKEEWGRFARPFDADLLRRMSYIPVTSLVRTELAVQAGFGPPKDVNTPYDDWGFYLRLLDLGARFEHVAEITWVWHHHGNNSSGQPDRW